MPELSERTDVPAVNYSAKSLNSLWWSSTMRIPLLCVVVAYLHLLGLANVTVGSARPPEGR